MPNVTTLRVPECAACHALCCRVSVIPLMPHYKWDRDVIAAGMARPDDTLGWTILRQANGACVYLDATSNRCTIYARRPLVCRSWSCLSREDATKLVITALDANVDPRGTPPWVYLQRKARGIWETVRRRAQKQFGPVPR